MCCLVLTNLQAGCWKRLFFPEGGTIAQVVVSPLPKDLFSEGFPVYQSSLSLPHSRVHTRIWPQSGGKSEFRAWGLGGVHVSGWGILGWGSPSGYGPASCWSPEISQQVFHPFNGIWYFYLFPDLPSPAHWRSHLNTLGAAGEKWASPAVSHTAAVASSHFLLSLPPTQVSATSFRFALCCLRERGSTSQVPLTVSTVSKLLLCFPNRVLESLMWRLEFHKGFLIHRCLLKSALS